MSPPSAAVLALSLALALRPGPVIAELPAPSTAPSTVPPRPIEMPLAWRLDHSLCEPETAVRDARAGAIYVSNVCGFSKDGHGFISKLADGGDLLERFWADGLDAPVGMAIADGRLWVADVDVVRVFDLDSAEQVETLAFPPELEARALNDVALGPDGALYVSDSARSAVYRHAGGRGELLARDDRLRYANGLHWDDGGLWVGSGSGLYRMDPGSGAIGERLGPPELADVDGIESDGSGGLLVSIVGGLVWHLPRSGPLTILTTPGLSSTNLGYFPELGLIVVPTGTDGTVLAFPFPPSEEAVRASYSRRLRVATFNVFELSRDKLDEMDEEGHGTNPQLRAAAEIVRRVRPDVLLLQEIDHDLGAAGGATDLAANARRFVDRYLAAPARDGGGEPLTYAHFFSAPVNTGVPSGHDLDNDGRIAGPESVGERGYGEDSLGFGSYPGQYATVLLSNYPIQTAAARTFQRFAWRDLPGHHLPAGFYAPQEIEVLRLSSKSHWDVPIDVDGVPLRLWISHPTPPVFDGPEDRNGRRNYDEIAFWLAYLDGEPALADDAGLAGGRKGSEPFVILGDLNADLERGDAFEMDGVRAIERLLADPRVVDTGALLTSRGALLEAPRDAPRDEAPGPPDYPERATAVFLGGMRLDYLLPSRDLEVVGGGTFWPAPDEDPTGARWAELASDHRLVWIDLELTPR